MSNPELENLKYQIKKHFKKAALIVFGFIALVSFNSLFYTVDPDEEAILIRFGKYLTTQGPGLHFKLPLGIDSITKVKTKRVLQEEFGFRTQSTSGRRTNYSSANFDGESLMLTGDLNVADVEWVVQFQIADPYKFIYQTSEPLQNIRDVSESVMRRVVGDRSVAEVLTVGRTAIAIEAKDLTQQVLDKYDMGVRIVTIKLQDVNPPEMVKPSFNEVNEAKQEQEKMINQAEESYNRIIPEARGKAEKLVSEAEGYALSVVNRAEGDVEKFKQILVSYKKSPKITRKRLYLEAIEQVLQSVENVTIVDPSIKGLLPLYANPTSSK